MFDGTNAEGDMEEQLLEAGIKFDRLRWDCYDGSLELDNVPNDVRLSEDQQKLIHSAGFRKVYVNHQDKSETHYTWGYGEFHPMEGWRTKNDP